MRPWSSNCQGTARSTATSTMHLFSSCWKKKCNGKTWRKVCIFYKGCAQYWIMNNCRLQGPMQHGVWLTLLVQDLYSFSLVGRTRQTCLNPGQRLGTLQDKEHWLHLCQSLKNKGISHSLHFISIMCLSILCAIFGTIPNILYINTKAHVQVKKGATVCSNTMTVFLMCALSPLICPMSKEHDNLEYAGRSLTY